MRALVLALTLLLAACAQRPPQDDSLYRELGEQAGITRIVEGMLLNVARDQRIFRHFQNIDIVRLRDKLVEQFCAESGGPCDYTGDSMQESHKGLDLSPSDFNALVEDLQASMDDQGVPIPAQNRLLVRLAPMRGDVIRR
jgi:hemoglobin